MQPSKLLFSWLPLLCSASLAQGQGTFQNLNFESANVAGYSTGGVPITNALPGWTGYIGSVQVDQIIYNTVSLGAATISLQGPGSLSPAIQGNYSAILQATVAVSPETTAAIAQTGQIPASAQSLRFYSGSQSMQVTFGGQTIPLTLLSTEPRYLIMGADISAFAGQTQELRFTMPVVQFSFTIPYLDNILFSNQPIPEPSVFSLFGLGALLLGWRFQRK